MQETVISEIGMPAGSGELAECGGRFQGCSACSPVWRFPTRTVAKFQWLGLLPLPRAWVSVDATFNGKAFRLIGTHLESVLPSVREAQGAELRAGPANTSLPVILAMDSNAPAFPLPLDPTYMDFMAAGYDDAWTQIFPLVNFANFSKVWVGSDASGHQRCSGPHLLPGAAGQ